jgi:hypothetical protein
LILSGLVDAGEEAGPPGAGGGAAEGRSPAEGRGGVRGAVYGCLVAGTSDGSAGARRGKRCSRRYTSIRNGHRLRTCPGLGPVRAVELLPVVRAPYRLYRLLTQLRLAGILGGIAGFVFGRTDCEPADGYGSLTLKDVLEDHIAPLDVPGLLYAAETVVGESGRASFGGSRRAGDTSGSLLALLTGMPTPGLEDARTAEIHFIVRVHGPVVPELMPGMIHTFGGGCVGMPANGILGPPGDFECHDPQFAVHQP